MPLKVFKRKFKDGTESEHYWMRGTVAGREIFRSTKKIKRAEARRVADRTSGDMEEDAEAYEREGDTRLVIEVAEEYFQAGGERRYIEKAMELIGMDLITDIDQHYLDTKAQEMYPNVSNASRVRWFYTPIIALQDSQPSASGALPSCLKSQQSSPRRPSGLKWIGSKPSGRIARTTCFASQSSCPIQGAESPNA